MSRRAVLNVRNMSALPALPGDGRKKKKNRKRYPRIPFLPALARLYSEWMTKRHVRRRVSFALYTETVNNSRGNGNVFDVIPPSSAKPGVSGRRVCSAVHDEADSKSYSESRLNSLVSQLWKLWPAASCTDQHTRHTNRRRNPHRFPFDFRIRPYALRWDIRHVRCLFVGCTQKYIILEPFTLSKAIVDWFILVVYGFCDNFVLIKYRLSYWLNWLILNGKRTRKKHDFRTTFRKPSVSVSMSNSYTTQDIKEKVWNDIFTKKINTILVNKFLKPWNSPGSWSNSFDSVNELWLTWSE